jgi:hypothetical protein
VSREWRIVMETGDAGEIATALRCTELDVELEQNVVYCYVDAPHNPKRVRKELKHDLAAFGFAENVPDPIPIERWDEKQERYVDSSGAPEHERLPAALEPYEIRWAVAVEPSSVFETRKLLEELRNRRRHEIGETKSGVEVGARDEADARALCDELGRLPIVGSVSARKLSWFDRWQVREHLAGNYTGPPDPTQSGFY